MNVAPHIFTLTGHLLAERTFEYASWSAGKTQRASSETFQVGGKGINVSKMLYRLGVANTALCFAGGASGLECEAWLQARRFSHRAFASDRGNRVGMVVRSANHLETTFLGPDVAPSPEAVDACAAFLDAQLDGQVLAFCGSFPSWEDIAYDGLRAALERWLRRGILAVDTYGPPLIWLTQHPLGLAKINAIEFRALAGNALSIAAALNSASPTWPVARWVVSDGPGLVTFRDGPNGAPDSIMPPSVQEVSATGSGDVLFACLLQSLYVNQTSLREALARALPVAAANAAHPGIAEFPDPPDTAI